LGTSFRPGGDDVRSMIAHGGTRAVFQPIVDVDASTVIGYEALARGPVGIPLERPVALRGHRADAA
jgi:hypothetical protein